MKKNLIAIPSQIEKITTRVDRTLKIEIGTSELPSDVEAQILDMRQKQGFTVFSMDEIESEDIPDVSLDIEAGENKGPSQRLRNALWQVWDKNTSKSQPFDVYYRAKMEQIINTVKEKI